MIRATVVKEVVEVMYFEEPAGWADYSEARKRQYVLEQMEGGEIEDSDILETRSVYDETLHID